MADENKIEEGGFEENELEDLFAALGDVSATDDFIAATIEHIDEVEGATEKAGGETPTGSSGKTTTAKAKFRAIRIGAIAACLALALTGGIAYAIPTSHVTVSQGDAAIELGVNRFGMVVSATSESEEGQEAIGSADLLNKPYEDSLARAVKALGKFEGDRPVDVSVESGDDAQRDRLDSQSAPFRSERSQGDGGSGGASGSDDRRDAGDGGAPSADERSGDPGASGAPQGDSGTDSGRNQDQNQNQGQGQNPAQEPDSSRGQNQDSGQDRQLAQPDSADRGDNPADANGRGSQPDRGGQQPDRSGGTESGPAR